MLLIGCFEGIESERGICWRCRHSRSLRTFLGLEVALVVVARGFAGFATGAALLGVGTAMVYPTLLAAIGDVAHPSSRASSVGVYRLWRDLGYALGALLAGVIAD